MRTTVILSVQDVDRLDQLARQYPLAPRHRLAQAAIRRGLRQLAAAPAELLAETTARDAHDSALTNNDAPMCVSTDTLEPSEA